MGSESRNPRLYDRSELMNASGTWIRIGDEGRAPRLEHSSRLWDQLLWALVEDHKEVGGGGRDVTPLHQTIHTSVVPEPYEAPALMLLSRYDDVTHLERPSRTSTRRRKQR